MQKVIKPLNDLFLDMNYKKNSQRHTNIISHVLRIQLKCGESENLLYVETSHADVIKTILNAYMYKVYIVSLNTFRILLHTHI